MSGAQCLEQILDKWLTKELQPWPAVPHRLPAHLRAERLALSDPARSPPGVIGHWTNDIVYDRRPGIRRQLHGIRGSKQKEPTEASASQISDDPHGILNFSPHLRRRALMKPPELGNSSRAVARFS